MLDGFSAPAAPVIECLNAVRAGLRDNAGPNGYRTCYGLPPPVQFRSLVERDYSNAMLDDEIRYQILKAVEEYPSMSQRELAAHLGVSLGKTNYCLKELIKKGLIKVGNFTANPNKRAYAYLLTPSGVKEKTQVTIRFLERKMHEYESIKKEIARLKSEVEHEKMVTDQR